MRVAAALIFALTLFAQDPSKGVNFYSLEKEKALGKQLANEYRGRTRPIDSPDTLAWINAMGARLAGSQSTYTYTFALIADDATLLHEATAFPGGFVFIPATLILGAQSEDEFAGMLAHSMAHIEARHGSKQATKGQIMNVATTPLIFMGGWKGYAIQQGASLAVPLGFLKMHRVLELQADTMAVQMMSDAGYDPAALARYIEREQAPDDPQPKPFSPIPERSERVAAIRAIVTGRVYPDHPGFTAIQDEVRRLTSALEKPKAPPTLIR
jgi:predicted Zn-dependent protease